MMWKTITANGLLWALLTPAAIAATDMPRAPKTWTADGACPFECCTYQDWGVERKTSLLEKPEEGAPVIASIAAGATVKGLTGKVMTTQAGKIRVLRDYLSAQSGHEYRRGDTVWVYTGLGEGFFSVWHGGQLFQEEAGFMYEGRGGWDSCSREGNCWGARVSFPKSVWWVKVKTAAGLTGWTRETDHFSHMDSCS